MTQDERVANIQELFPGGKWASQDEYSIPCPYCGDAKSHWHFFFNVAKGIFHCFFCGESGTLGRLMRDHASLLAATEVRYAEARQAAELAPPPVVDKTDFGAFRKIPLGDGPALGQRARHYLNERGISDSEISAYDIRYAAKGRYAGRAIVPIVEAGAIVCFSARAFAAGVEPKYLFPKKGESLLSASDSIFNYNSLEERSAGIDTVVITEGIFDAMAVERLRVPGLVCVSTLSKNISDAQALKLLALRANKRYVLMLDSPVKDVNIARDVARAASKLAGTVPGANVAVATLPTNDPAASPAAEVLAAIEAAEEYGLETAMRTTMARTGEAKCARS